MKMIRERDSFRHSLNFQMSPELNRDDERGEKYQTGSTRRSLETTDISSREKERNDVQMKSLDEVFTEIPEEFD